jgi:tetratricopeptide (TPR) repeat protein
MSHVSEHADREALGLARARADAGDEVGAERVFLELLSRHRETRSAIEQLACSSLVTLYGRQRRDFEVVTLAGHLRALGEAAEDGLASRAYAAFVRASAWTSLHALDAAETELGRLCALIEHLEPARAPLFEKLYRLLRMRVAIGRGDPVEARERLEPYLEILPPASDIGRDDALARDHHQAEICLLEGRIAAGLAFAAAAEAIAVEAPDLVGVWITKLSLLARGGRQDELRDSARSVIGRLEGFLDGLPFAAQAAWDGACCLLDVLEDVPDAEPLVLRAWDLASTALVRRLQEIERAVLMLPELLHDEPRDAGVFRAIREASQCRREEQRRHLQPILARWGAAPHETPDGALLVICAWCDAIRIGEDRWLPLLKSYYAVGPMLASHGMCTACAAAQEV